MRMNLTRFQAAKKAGIHPVQLIKEPEAAALYTLHVLQDKALAVWHENLCLFIDTSSDIYSDR